MGDLIEAFPREKEALPPRDRRRAEGPSGWGLVRVDHALEFWLWAGVFSCSGLW